MGRQRLHKRANGEGSVYLRRDGRWAAEITTGFDEQGRQTRSRVYARTQAEARSKLDAMRRRTTQGLSAIPSRLTVEEFLERWLTTTVCRPHVSFKTADTYRDLVRIHIVPLIGRIELSKLSDPEVQNMVNALLVKPRRGFRKKDIGDPTNSPKTLSRRTVKHCRDALRAACNVAIKWGLISRNPAASVAIKAERRRITIFDEKQAATFLEAIDGERIEALYWVALCLASREGEILGLKWLDIDFEARRMQLMRALQRVRLPDQKKSELKLVDTKTEDSDRSVWLPQVVISKLLIHEQRQIEERACAGSAWIESGLVFTTQKGTPLDPRNLQRDFCRIRDRAGLPHIRFHDLRHSAATILKMAGIPDQVIQKLLGHASVRTTQEIYTHTTADADKQAARKMDEIFQPVAVKVAVKNARVKPN